MSDTITDGLRATEAGCAEGREAPRVSLADIEANIAWEGSVDAAFAFVDAVRRIEDADAMAAAAAAFDEVQPTLSTLTLYAVVLKNGFTVIGKSAPASPENFDEALGAKLAKEDAIRQIWPLMGYALREKLHNV